MMTFFEKKNKSIANLIIALASNISAHSPTELALNPLYKYQYSSICDAIENFFYKDKEKKEKEENPLDILTINLKYISKKEVELRDFLKEFFPEKSKNKFWNLNTDATSVYKEHSPTLKDKEFVHAANTVIKDNKPITIGHRLSVVGLSARENNIAWNLPISMLKVPFDQKSNEFAAEQIKCIFSDKELFDTDLVVNSLDSAYCNVGYSYSSYEIQNLISIIRIAGHRNVFNIYEGEIKTGQGAKNKYGKIFKLSKVETHTKPDKIELFDWTMQNGRKCNVTVNQWNDMIISGKRNKKMYNKPFNLVSIKIIDIESQEPIYKKNLWLTVWGEKRNEINLREIYESFRNRFDIEFFFRFGKQKLLLNKFQTPDIKHEQNWFWIVMLSYWLLYLSRNEGENIIRPWEKYNPKNKQKEVPKNETKTPTQTQRAMQTIFSDFAKNNLIPKTHNIHSGRKHGEKQIPREHFIVQKRSKKNVKLQI